MKIAIRTKTKKQFPPKFLGFIEMEIDLIQNNVAEQSYSLRIKDSCIDITNRTETNEQGKEVTTQEEIVLTSMYRDLKSYSYDEVNTLSKMLQLDRSKFKSETEYINELFRKGLLITTQKECVDGLGGAPGLGMFFTEASDWEIVRNND